MQTPTDLRVLHAVRTLGSASTDRIAARLGMDTHDIAEHLLDAEAVGQVLKSAFDTDTGWSLTEAGKLHGERLLAAELDACHARPVVEAVYQDFLPVNAHVSATCTAWQLQHGDADEASGPGLGTTVDALLTAAATLGEFEVRLINYLPRFAGYHTRFAEAAARSTAEPAWITGIDRDSCHRVWFELHEDLIATLGLTR